MSRRMATLGFAALCALAFSAFAPSGLLAAPTESNTAFTCVEVEAGTGEFTNVHCSSKEGTPKNWKHVEIKEGEETQLTFTAIGEQIFTTKIAIAKVVLAGKGGVECKECMVHNQTDPGGKMDITGTGRLRYTGVQINVAACAVENDEIVTELLKFTSVTASTVSFEPVVPPNWARVKLVPSGAGPCPLGNEILITGHANASAKGATLTFNTGANELLVGAQKMELKGELTMSAGLTGGVHRPIGLTPTP
jgi:hypothetical protein